MRSIRWGKRRRTGSGHGVQSHRQQQKDRLAGLPAAQSKAMDCDASASARYAQQEKNRCTRITGRCGPSALSLRVRESCGSASCPRW
jgi:hypothetical protein